MYSEWPARPVFSRALAASKERFSPLASYTQTVYARRGDDLAVKVRRRASSCCFGEDTMLRTALILSFVIALSTGCEPRADGVGLEPPGLNDDGGDTDAHDAGDDRPRAHPR